MSACANRYRGLSLPRPTLMKSNSPSSTKPISCSVVMCSRSAVSFRVNSFWRPDSEILASAGAAAARMVGFASIEMFLLDKRGFGLATVGFGIPAVQHGNACPCDLHVSYRQAGDLSVFVEASESVPLWPMAGRNEPAASIRLPTEAVALGGHPTNCRVPSTVTHAA